MPAPDADTTSCFRMEEANPDLNSGNTKMDASSPKAGQNVSIFLIGDSFVGKQSLLHRFVNGTYGEIPHMLYGWDMKEMDLEGKMVKFRIFKTNAMERSRHVRHSDYRQVPAEGFIIIFDVTNQESFDHLEEWLQEIDCHAQKNASKILVGNKCDLTEKRAVPYTVAKELADRLDIPLFETSAKDGTNVHEIFVAVSTEILRRKCSDKGNVDLDLKEKSRSLGCNT